MIAIPEKTNYKFYKLYTDQLTHKQCVILALYCAEISFHFPKDKLELEEKAKICIELVKQWLEDPESVTKNQLINAADAADAANAAAWAYAEASWAADAASSASWAANASSAAWAYVTVAWAASDAASAAASASAVTTDTAAKIKIIPYLESLLTVKLPKIKYNDPLEQLVFYTDQLNLQLLIPSINGYRLNLWDKSYEYQIEGTIEEIANTTGIKYLLKGIQE